MIKKLMKLDRNSCDLALLSRFLDQELGPDDRVRINKHLKQCPACRRVLRGDQSISAFFKTGLQEELSHTAVEESEEKVFDLIRSKGIPWWMKVTDLLRSKRFYVPAAAMATLLILVLSVVRRPAFESGPSAIVSSFKGDVASVMILETRKSHQTILWFNESPDFRR